jgi:diaminopimelate epimerase
MPGRVQHHMSLFYLILAGIATIMIIPFHKYQGTGNDFILLDGRQGLPQFTTEVIARLCDRHFGIGADGLIILSQADGFDFRMSYYNSDGRESTMCGNGGRCITAFADFLSLAGNMVSFIAADGPHKARIISRTNRDNWLVSLRMNDVKEIRDWGGCRFLDTGSPHLVKFTEDLSFDDIRPLARPLRYHPDFAPSGTNVNFVKVTGQGIHVRSYERGVEDETLSCGTGVTAAALAFAREKGMHDGEVEVTTSGGELRVKFGSKEKGIFTDIWLEGPAVKVFEGVLSASWRIEF